MKLCGFGTNFAQIKCREWLFLNKIANQTLHIDKQNRLYIKF